MPLTDQYSDVRYNQFKPSRTFSVLLTIARVLTWPLAWPLAGCCKLSDILFRTTSEALSLIPYFPGIILRGEFYRFALKRCGRNVVVEFGTVFVYSDVSVGSHVLIGRYNTIHHCDFGDYVMTAEGCAFLSGSRHHRFDLVDTPMALQGGQKKRIVVEDDCWIGAHAVVMEPVRRGSIVGAGSIVTKAVDAFSIVVGNPARVVRERIDPAVRA